MKTCPWCGKEITGGYRFKRGNGIVSIFCSEACFDEWADNEVSK